MHALVIGQVAETVALHVHAKTSQSVVSRMRLER